MQLPNPAPVIRDLGRADYEPVFARMRAFTDARTTDTPDEMWVVEHPPVFTLGLGADRGHVLNANDIPVVQTDRGGEVTFHGPGQVVIYLLMDLRRNKPGGKLYLGEFHKPELWVLRALSWTYFKVFEPLGLALWDSHDPMLLLEFVGELPQYEQREPEFVVTSKTPPKTAALSS